MKLGRSLFSSCFYNKKGLAFGLWLVWLCGIFFIGVSFYATRMLSLSMKDQLKKPKLFGNRFSDSFDPKVTIFTAPRAFVGSVGERQELAVRSWIGLSSSINVVLFSQDSSAVSFAAAFGSRVSVERNIDFTFLGNPFFHSMVARSQASASDVSVLIDPEMVLFPDFFSTLKYADKLDHDWLLVASSPNVSYFPFLRDADGTNWLSHEGNKITNEKGFLAQILECQYCDRRMLLAWNNGDVPLHNGVIPPFLYGKGIHNHWFITEALSSDYRFVFDASWTVSSTYVSDLNHEYYQLIKASNDSDIEKRNWEFIGNVYLGKLYGSFSFRGANFTNLFRFYNCGGHYLFTNKEQNIVYPLGEDMSFSLRKQGTSGPIRGKKILDCVDAVKSNEGIENCSLKNQLHWSNSLLLPYSLELLLSLIANQNRTVVLAVAGHSYKDMLMSWVCRLRYLQISNFLVGAIDPDIYEFSIQQGLAVFAYEDAPANISFDNCHFGTECFQKVTKVKSRMVLQILKLGYNVLMSDVDVYWFKNPLPLMSSFGPAILVAQSDEYKTTGPINLPRRLNSGFYYANSDGQTITALQKVVEHASVSNLSEQPSFYDTLCGEGGSHRVGDDRCLEPETNLTVHFLDRDLFPNGAYQDLWQERSVKETCWKKGCFVLHNNWINGRRKKLERQSVLLVVFLDKMGFIDFHEEENTRSGISLALWPSEKSYGLGFITDAIFGGLRLLAMLRRWALMLGLVRRRIEYESKCNNQLALSNIKVALSIQLRDSTVRIVHPGGKTEVYQHPIPASFLMDSYPGMEVTRPDVFKHPHGHDSVLSPENYLFPGNKYYLVPSSTLQKLKRRHLRKEAKMKQLQGSEQPILAIKDVSEVGSEESPCSAKEFFICNEKYSDSLLKRTRREKKPFVPPIQKPRVWKDEEWEPSLTSIHEVSP